MNIEASALVCVSFCASDITTNMACEGFGFTAIYTENAMVLRSGIVTLHWSEQEVNDQVTKEVHFHLGPNAYDRFVNFTVTHGSFSTSGNVVKMSVPYTTSNSYSFTMQGEVLQHKCDPKIYNEIP